MTNRRSLCLLLLGGFCSQLGWRASQVALPLVALASTGSVGAMGLVGGAAGLPVLLSPWWTRRLRTYVASPRRTGALEMAGGLVTVALPMAALADALAIWLLVAVGFVTGALGALSAPSRLALVADVGDRVRDDGAARMLAWSDAGTRLAQVVGPAAAGVVVATGHSVLVLVAEAGLYVVGGLLVAPVAPVVHDRGTRDEDVSIRGSVTGHPEVVRGWILRAVGCFGWFAFTLGLAAPGAGVHGGRALALAMACYGGSALMGSVLAVRTISRYPALRLARLGWAGAGAGFVTMGLWPTYPGLALGAMTMGLTVPVGNAAVTATITRVTGGHRRRAALSGQQTVVTAASTLGLLIGGSVIAALGPEATLVVAGTIIAATAVLVGAGSPRATSSRSRPPDHILDDVTRGRERDGRRRARPR